MLPGQGWGWGRRDPFSCVLANLGIAVGIRQVPTANAEPGDMDWDVYQAQSAMRRPASTQSVIAGLMDSPNRPAQRRAWETRQDKTSPALPGRYHPGPPKSRQLSFSRLSASRQPPPWLALGIQNCQKHRRLASSCVALALVMCVTEPLPPPLGVTPAAYPMDTAAQGLTSTQTGSRPQLVDPRGTKSGNVF